MRFIKLTKGFSAIVDDEDYEWLNQWKWYASTTKRSKTIYARRSKDDVMMHRIILGIDNPKILTDHKDCNGLNNSRSNLRTATYSENNANMPHHENSSSIYKGVSLSKGKYWLAQIRKNGKTKHLGHFENEAEAAIAYNKAAVEYFGEFAKLNKVA